MDIKNLEDKLSNLHSEEAKYEKKLKEYKRDREQLIEKKETFQSKENEATRQKHTLIKEISSLETEIEKNNKHIKELSQDIVPVFGFFYSHCCSFFWST